MTQSSKSCLWRRGVAGTAFCLLTGALAYPVSPARADLFGHFNYPAYQRPAYERAPPRLSHHRQRHKAPRQETKVDKQPVPHGPVQVVVSIGRQRAYLYAGGVPVAEGRISTGVPGHPTPMGVFSVIAKARYHRSNIYSGAPMPYMQRITWSGIALHEGPLPGYPASHGCIRLTTAFAQKLWAVAKVGARVIVMRDEVAPMEFDSDRLIALTKPEEKQSADPATATPVLLAARSASAFAGTALADDTAAPHAPAGLPVPAAQPPAAAPEQPPKEAAKPTGPLEILVSRKAAKVYVKQRFTPLFEAPVTIAEPDKPWGTHVFTLMDIKDGKADWTVMSIPSGYAHRPARHHGKRSARETREMERQEKRAAEATTASPGEALARFQLPADAIARISALLVPGSSLIVSDNGLSEETGPDTGFIVSTR